MRACKHRPYKRKWTGNAYTVYYWMLDTDDVIQRRCAYVISRMAVAGGASYVANDCVKRALLSFAERPTSSKRSRIARQQVQLLFSKISEETLSEFSSKLVATLQQATSSSGLTPALYRESLWKFFHRIRNTELPKIWKRFLDNIGLDLDGLVQQFVSQKVFEEIVEALCDSARSESESESDTTNTRNLSCEEEMVIRYASGYVPFKLMKKHERNLTAKSALYVECLSGMAINGEESSLLDYTAQWIREVNRGGLFEVNDTAYLLFREIELYSFNGLSGK